MEINHVVTALAALAQGTRLSIFRALVEAGPPGIAAGAIAARLDIAPPTLSFHLKELVHAGLIAARQDGRFILYRADYDAINALIAFLTENCCRASGVCMTECAPDTAAACVPAAAITPTRRRAPASARARRASTRRVR